ncbi:hypothetical protein NDU88_011686 [Pleurodeles waltl]|uniref:Uncharacterized protein n=1 Tax=Pleurodeles waltl TaxID=8319 RepID=A0AAV7R2E2_PLEWA|nr:hypothetical protein NDU88_011686 [Pleurodeles waltl]
MSRCDEALLEVTSLHIFILGRLCGLLPFVPGLGTERCLAVSPTGLWAGSVFGSRWLGRAQAAEARVLCFRVYVLCWQRHGEADAVAVVCGLVGRTYLAEEAVIRDAVDKKVDVSLKKA